MSPATHRPRQLFSFEYYFPTLYSKRITCLTVYMRRKWLFLFARCSILNRQPECDCRCGGTVHRKTGNLRAFTEITQKPLGRIICTRSGTCANEWRDQSKTWRRRQTGIAHITAGHLRSKSTAGIADISAANGCFRKPEPSNLVESAAW